MNANLNTQRRNTADSPRSAFQELLILEERVRLSGASLPKHTDFREKLPGVEVCVAGHDFLIPISEVAEIMEKKKLTAIPGCLSWVKGVLNLRGRLLPVYGAADFFRRQATGTTASGALEILVVDKGALFCGIAVDEIRGMEKFYREDFRQVGFEEEASLGPLAGFADSVTQFGEKLVYRLNIAAMAKVLSESNPLQGR